MDLCGEPVPLHDQDVKERFDKEFTLIVYNQAQVYLWLKRMERYFPWIEERLKAHGLPDDLKYVAIVESDLLPNAVSPKGASGPWQFMASTGAAYGLEQQGSCDFRHDFEKATEGAFRLLNDLHTRYKSWALAIATYNCGDKRILEEMRAQKVNDYYSLKLPLETERYVLRALAIKAVLQNPAQYGYNLPPGQGYPPLNMDRVKVTLSSPVPIQTIASAANSTFREIKRLNPIFRSDDIPAGTHSINLPTGSRRSFEKNFGQCEVTTASVPMAESVRPVEPPKEAATSSIQRPAQPAEPKASAKNKNSKVHTVGKGDTLSSIARKYDVSTKELIDVNKLKESNILVGQKIMVP
jgi:LysM repeat protein